MPHARAHVLNQAGTITSNHEANLRHPATGAPLFQHIATKNKWTSAVMRTINWRAHGLSLKQRIHRRVHYTKLVHDLLPVNAHVHRHDDRPVAGWFEQDDFFIDTSEYSSDLQRLGAQQQAIGWRQLFDARFSEEWSRLQDDYYVTSARHKHNKRLTGARWQTTIIGVFWDHWDLLWAQQNQNVHGADKASQTAALRLDVDRTLADLYRTKEHLNEPVRQLMRATEEEHRREPMWVTQNWIAVHGQLIRDNLRAVQARAKSGMRHIRSYFAVTENH